MNELTTTNRTSRLPFCNVPNVQSMRDFAKYCTEHNLKMVQVTQEEMLQKVTVTHDLQTGEIRGWELSPNFPDGLMGILVAGEAVFLLPSVIVAGAAMSIVDYYTQGPGHVDLGTGEAMIAIGFKDGKLSIRYEPDSPLAFKKVLMAVILATLASEAGTHAEKMERLLHWFE